MRATVDDVPNAQYESLRHPKKRHLRTGFAPAGLAAPASAMRSCGRSGRYERIARTRPRPNKPLSHTRQRAVAR